MRFVVLLASMLVLVPALAVPPGYRYVGSRVVSNGAVVYWYWDAAHVQIAASGTSFVANLYARAADADQERPYVAIVRCDARMYRDLASNGPYARIDDGEPIDAVWRAGCDNGIALQAAARAARLGDAPAAMPVTAQAPVVVAQAPAKGAPPSPSAEPADPRRADACVRFAEGRTTPAGDATITNSCAYAIELTICYRGGSGGVYDCPRGRLGDSLRPGGSHVLPEYRRGRHKGIDVVACRGEPGTVFPRLGDGGKGGCFD